MYIKFCNFGPYTDVKLPDEPKPEVNTDVYRRVRVYKWISAVFIILTLVLLAVVLALAIKLYEGQSIQHCPEIPEADNVPVINCNRELCQTMYPSSSQAVQRHEYRCTDCGADWVKLNKSCYFISRERLTWWDSREACLKRGGDLLVINNEHVQKLLTNEGVMLYWIGLHYSENQKWTWINNTTLTQSYWAPGQPGTDSPESCALLGGQAPDLNNWISNHCGAASQYICQKG